MPSCNSCPFFDDIRIKCRQPAKPGCATRSCVHGFVDLRLGEVWGDCLEIGAGVWKGPRRRMARAGAIAYGVDPRWSKPVERAYQAFADDLPFIDERFDFVVTVESAEHWDEKGHDTAKGFREVWRVLRQGGWLLATVPIHLHGSEPFVMGDLAGIRSLLGGGWGSMSFEAWRKDCAPLEPSYNWRTEAPYVTRMMRRKFRGKMPHNWMLEIMARKVIADAD